MGVEMGGNSGMVFPFSEGWMRDETRPAISMATRNRAILDSGGNRLIRFEKKSAV
jgi:hypothetical protein